MASLRCLVPLTLAATLGIFAAPAHATLLVRSDGAGLLIQDKNGIADNADMFAVNSQTAYRIRNLNDGDIFKFDRQVGCQEHSSFEVTCQRNGSAINVLLAGGNDRLNMASAPAGQSSVAGGSGNDTVIGHIAVDNLHGQTGDDDLTGAGGNDFLDGGDGNDDLDGGGGNDTLDGGNNADTLRGSTGTDGLNGSAGNDSLFAREPVGTTSVADTVTCGSGTDFAEVDLKDFVSASCEQKDVAPVGEPNVKMLDKTLRVAGSGRVNVRLRCPRAVGRIGCDGRLRLTLARGSRSQASRSRRVRYRIRAGRRRSVALQLTTRDVKALRGGARRGVLTSVEKGHLGAKTTVRTPRLRLRRR